MFRQILYGIIHKGCQHGGGRGWHKIRHSKQGFVNLVLEISPKCGQGGRGLKIPKNLGTSFMYGPKFEFDPPTQRLGAGEENKIIQEDS